jgi:hypothetical protein
MSFVRLSMKAAHVALLGATENPGISLVFREWDTTALSRLSIHPMHLAVDPAAFLRATEAATGE